ncbi:MAG: insulinase family protein [Pseudomonadales bacterium]
MPKLSSRLLQLSMSLCVAITLAACTTTLDTYNTTEDVSNDIIKSPTDNREYLAFELENKLQVLVISDPEADKAAASLSVAVGSGSDPKDREGLAHFLEHMLFLGTEKYPKAGAYQEFISQHGGSHNAYTSFDETNYFFDVNIDDLEPTLDQFAQFFIAPLFDAQYVEREKHAVHSEYQAKIKDDSRLQYDVLKAIGNPEHPFSQFSVGSLDTLADHENKPVRNDLLVFYQQHYSANRMSLVVLGKQSVSELRQLVSEKFAAVANHNSPASDFKQPLFKKQQLPLRVSTIPNKNLRQLSYYFPIASTRAHIDSKPVNYISNLLGHEGEGSLLSYLKNQGWADSLSAGMGFEDNQQASLNISIGLTESGLKNTDAITRALFQSIELTKQQGLQEWRFDEQAQLAKLAFEFQENGNNMHYVTRLASHLKQVPATQVLSAPYQMTQYKPALLSEYLKALRPNNMLMMVVGKGLSVDQHSEHFNAPYAVADISDEQISLWQNPTLNPAIKLPAANPFIPNQLSIIKAPYDATANPQQLLTESGIVTWHSLDTSFKTPKADVYFTLRSPMANQSALNVALTSLYVKTVNERLNEFSYPAALAGLSYQLYPHVRGISVRISGYQDKQPLLLEEILSALNNADIKAATFLRHKDELLRGWQNALQQKPYQQSLARTSKLVTKPSWTESQLISALEPIQTNDLQQFADDFLAQLNIEVLANGNISAGSAVAMTDQIARQLKGYSHAVKVTRPDINKLSAEQKLLYQFDVPHTDNAATLYIQGENKSIETRARFGLLNQILSTPFYHELRTRQQLGYIVFSSPMTLIDVPALSFTVQSPSTSASDIVSAMDVFLTGFSGTLNNMDEATLATHKKALIGRLIKKDSRITERSNRYWNEIDRSNFRFNTREQLATAIEAVDLKTIQESYLQDIIKQPRQLTIMAVGNAGNTPITDDYQLISRGELSQLNKAYVE